MKSIFHKTSVSRKPAQRAGLGSLCLLIMLSLVVGCAPTSAPMAATPTPIPTAVVPVKPTYTVQSGEIESKLQFSGRVVPVQEEGIFFRTSGRVRNVYVQNNDPVKAGDVLADLEVLDDLERRLESQQLNVRRAELNLEIAKIDYELFKSRTPTWSNDYALNLSKQDAYLELQEIAYREATLGKDDLEIAIKDAQLVAPFEGVVNSFTLKSGRGVEAFTVLAVVADLTELEVRSEISATDAKELSEGMAVSMVLPNRPSNVIWGTVRSLPYSVASGTVNVEDQDPGTRIAFESEAGSDEFTPGDLVRITVTLESKTDALWLPPQAIRTFEGRRFVVVKDGAAQLRIDVRLGIEGDGRIEIVEGLSEGQIVVSP